DEPRATCHGKQDEREEKRADEHAPIRRALPGRCERGLGHPIACARSAMRSDTVSMPTERRTRPAGGASFVPRTEPCVMASGTSMSDSTPPRDSASEKYFVRATIRFAAASPPLSSNDSIPPKLFIWRFASECCGCVGNPG